MDMRAGDTASAKGGTTGSEKPVQRGARFHQLRERYQQGHDPVLSLAYVSLIGLFVIACFAIMKVMAELLVPIIAAVIIGSVLSRIGDRLARFGAPRMLVGLGLVVLAGLVLFVLVDALLQPLSDMISNAPSMVSTLFDALKPLLQPFDALRTSLHLDGAKLTGPANADYTQWISAFLGGVTPALGELLVFFITLAFFVVSRVAVRRDMIMAFQSRKARLSTIRVFNAVEESLELYFSTIAMAYLTVGFLTGLIAYLTGLSGPVLWGALTFAACFVPYFGASLITLSLAAAGVVTQHSIGLGLLPAAGFLTVNLICDNAILPVFLGRRLEINPFLVFISIIFWTWMWGPIGAVMAIPLLLVGETILSELRAPQPELPE